MGNHDRELSPGSGAEAGFENVSELPCILDKYIILQHEPPEYYRNDTPLLLVTVTSTAPTCTGQLQEEPPVCAPNAGITVRSF